jgi:hypothetical protein
MIDKNRLLAITDGIIAIAATIMVLAAAIYVLCCKDALWQQLTAVGALIITPAWSVCYAALRITVDSTGITRRAITGSTRINWNELTTATLHTSSTPGTESCSIELCAGETRIRISSDLFPLEDVQELARELKECHLLH